MKAKKGVAAVGLLAILAIAVYVAIRVIRAIRDDVNIYERMWR